MVLLLACRVPDDQLDAFLTDLDNLLQVGGVNRGELLFVELTADELGRQGCFADTS
jgi:hypothetical protein